MLSTHPRGVPRGVRPSRATAHHSLHRHRLGTGGTVPTLPRREPRGARPSEATAHHLLCCRRPGAGGMVPAHPRGVARHSGGGGTASARLRGMPRHPSIRRAVLGPLREVLHGMRAPLGYSNGEPWGQLPVQRTHPVKSTTAVLRPWPRHLMDDRPTRVANCP